MNNRHQWRHNIFLKLQETDTRVNLEFIRKTVQHLPDVTEKLCYSTPAFYVNKKIFSRLKEDCETLVIQTFEREKLIETDPLTFFVTDHYINFDYMLVALKTVTPEDLTELLVTAWYNRAPTKLQKEYDGSHG